MFDSFFQKFPPFFRKFERKIRKKKLEESERFGENLKKFEEI